MFFKAIVTMISKPEKYIKRKSVFIEKYFLCKDP